MTAFNLRAKLTLIIGGLIAITIAVAGIATRSVLNDSLEKANVQRAIEIGNELGRRLSPYLITNAPYELFTEVQAATKNPNIKYIILLNPSGKVLMHSDLKEVGKRYEDAQNRSANAAGKVSNSRHFTTKEGKLVDDVVIPIKLAEVGLGTLRLGYSHEESDKITSAASINIILIGALSTALALLGAFLTAGYLAKPIIKLTEATRKVTQGDLSVFVVNRSKDELGRLAEAFNKMTGELRSTTVSRDHMDNIFNSAGDALLVIDTDFNILAANKSMTRFLGTETSDLKRVRCFESFKGNFCQTADCILRRILQGEESVNTEAAVELPDGRKRFVQITGTPLIEKGQLIGIVESTQDITDKKEAEEEKELLQAQLLQAQKMESVGRLAGGVAHDFNNILSVIIGYTELTLNNLPDNDPMAKNLKTMGLAAEKAAALTSQLLAFSRKQMLSLQAVDINTIIGNISILLRRMLGENILLEFIPGTELDRVMADPNQIEQVLMNLAINARDAMPNGGRLIIETENTNLDDEYAHTHVVDKIGRFVRISVTDTGHGMNHELQEKIFDPFFTTKEVGKGTGLGLSTAYGIMKQHSGHLLVYSEPGHGTTFKLYLPATDNVETTRETQRSAELRTGTETVLVVDDEPSIRLLVKDSLLPLGYRVFEASNSEEALRLCGLISGEIDVLLTDVIMPGMNGWDLSKALKMRSPVTKTIFMSGYTKNVIANDGILKPDLVFIHKPLTSGKLSIALRNALDNDSVSGQVSG